jgi:hypothetical protein
MILSAGKSNPSGPKPEMNRFQKILSIIPTKLVKEIEKTGDNGGKTPIQFYTAKLLFLRDGVQPKLTGRVGKLRWFWVLVGYFVYLFATLVMSATAAKLYIRHSGIAIANFDANGRGFLQFTNG